jgi:glutathione synthase/RimK-type ligase-like ATP-grasp enzyme
MKVIGVLFGMEQTFPPALVERINSMHEADVRAEFVKVGAMPMDAVLQYDVILDRISHDIPFYRSLLKVAAIGGTIVVNNPFWWSADDKFFNYALMSRIGIPIPRTVLLPHKHHPPETTSESMRNLIYPLDWNAVFEYVGFPAFLKPHAGGGWKHVYKVHSPEEFFAAYDQTGDLCMVLQQAIEFTEYYRCYCIGRRWVRVMPYEPRNPHHERYNASWTPAPEMVSHIEDLTVKICSALGYDFNTVEFAVADGIPYAIDFLNPAPDAERTSVQVENFEWVVQTIAHFLIDLARRGRKPPSQYIWSEFLGKRKRT